MRPRGCARPTDLFALRAGCGLGPAFLLLSVAFAGLVRPGVAALPAPVEAQINQLDGVRQQCVAAALALQQRERSIGALDLAINVMQRGVENKTREIAQSRT